MGRKREHEYIAAEMYRWNEENHTMLVKPLNAYTIDCGLITEYVFIGDERGARQFHARVQEKNIGLVNNKRTVYFLGRGNQEKAYAAFAEFYGRRMRNLYEKIQSCYNECLNLGSWYNGSETEIPTVQLENVEYF